MKRAIEQIKRDFEQAYGSKITGPIEFTKEGCDGYFTFWAGSTYFRASVNGLATFVDPFTEESNIIWEGAFKGTCKCWYQEVA